MNKYKPINLLRFQEAEKEVISWRNILPRKEYNSLSISSFVKDLLGGFAKMGSSDNLSCGIARVEVDKLACFAKS